MIPTALERTRNFAVAYWLGLSGNARGAIFILLASASATLMFTVVKALGQRIESPQIAFFRALVGLIVATPILLRHRGGYRTRYLRFHIANGVFAAIAMALGYYAIANMNLADATALMFTRPLFLILLALLFLGELIRPRRWTATAFGFLGVLVIARPAGVVEPAVLAALGASLFSGGMIVMIKKMVHEDGANIQLFYISIFMGLSLAIPTALTWQTPTLPELGMLVVVGLLGAANNFFYVRGLHAGEATAVAPFDYSRLIMAGLLGYWLFAELPDLWSVAGAALIVGSNLYIARQESLDTDRHRRDRRSATQRD